VPPTLEPPLNLTHLRRHLRRRSGHRPPPRPWRA
jgi:hypothetical protein